MYKFDIPECMTYTHYIAYTAAATPSLSSPHPQTLAHIRIYGGILSKSQVKQHSHKFRVYAKWQAHNSAGTTGAHSVCTHARARAYATCDGNGVSSEGVHFTLSMLSLSIVMCITFYLPCSVSSPSLSPSSSSSSALANVID